MDRSSVADDIAYPAGFTKKYIKAGSFTLMTYQKFNMHSDTLSIYIEGDGRAWEGKYQLSDDPTPSNPVALRLAAEDPADNIAYIARPGQYSRSGIPECDLKYWSNARFAPEVISSFSRAIDLLKESAHTGHVELTGYSGGAAIAVLVAAQRGDVIALRTVAGNLNPEAFSRYHHVSQLNVSIGPMDVARELGDIPQRHFVGSMDKVVPLSLAESFVKMQGDKDDKRITMVDGVSHHAGWQERWRELLLMKLL